MHGKKQKSITAQTIHLQISRCFGTAGAQLVNDAVKVVVFFGVIAGLAEYDVTRVTHSI